MAIKSRTTKAATAANTDDAADVADNAPVVETTKTTSGGDVDPGEPTTEDPANRGPDAPDGPGVSTAYTEGADDDDDGEDNADYLKGIGTADDDGDDDEADDAHEAGSGDSVTMRTNDGATYKSNDGATGDNNEGEANTKEGDAPEGVNADRTAGGADEKMWAELTHGDAALGSFAPAATLNNPRTNKSVTDKVMEMLVSFDGKNEDQKVFATTNIFDEGLIQRADVPAFTKQVEDTFGVTITVSEGQNWLLARDIANTVLRKTAAE